MICRHCGAEVPDWMDFCPKCMKTVDRAESAKAPEKAAPAPAPAVQRTRKPEAEPEMVDDEASAVFEDEEEEAEVYQSPQRPKRGRRRKKKNRGNRFLWFLIGLLTAVAVIAGLMLAGVLRFGGANSAESPQLVAEQGYDKPEQALEAYAKAMQAGDLQGMLSTFAASNYLSHRSDYADYNTAFDEAPFWISANGMQELQVAGTPLSKAVAAEKVRSFLIDALIAQYCYPLFHENSHYVYNEEAQQYIIVTESESELQDFVKQISESAPMTDITVGTPFEVSDKLSSEAAANYQKLMASVARNCGGDAALVYCIPLTIDGEDYLLNMELVQYDGKWFNINPFAFGIVYKEGYANHNYGGLVPVAAIDGWE